MKCTVYLCEFLHVYNQEYVQVPKSDESASRQEGCSLLTYCLQTLHAMDHKEVAKGLLVHPSMTACFSVCMCRVFAR
jgi:hypothetical protein